MAPLVLTAVFGTLIFSSTGVIGSTVPHRFNSRQTGSGATTPFYVSADSIKAPQNSNVAPLMNDIDPQCIDPIHNADWASTLIVNSVQSPFQSDCLTAFANFGRQVDKINSALSASAAAYAKTATATSAARTSTVAVVVEPSASSPGLAKRDHDDQAHVYERRADQSPPVNVTFYSTAAFSAAGVVPQNPPPGSPQLAPLPISTSQGSCTLVVSMRGDFGSRVLAFSDSTQGVLNVTSSSTSNETAMRAAVAGDDPAPLPTPETQTSSWSQVYDKMNLLIKSCPQGSLLPGWALLGSNIVVAVMESKSLVEQAWGHNFTAASVSPVHQ